MRYFIFFYESKSPTDRNFRAYGTFGIAKTKFPALKTLVKEQANFIRENSTCKDAFVNILNWKELSEQDFKDASEDV